jgi:hypothetical protein
VIKGGIRGISGVSSTQKMWSIAQAVGDITVAYPYIMVLLEIEVCLRM